MFFKILTFLPFSYTESSDLECFTLQAFQIYQTDDNNDSDVENKECNYICVYRSFIQKLLENIDTYNTEELSSSSSEIENPFKLELLNDFHPGYQDSESLIEYEESSEASNNLFIPNQPLDDNNNFTSKLADVDFEVTMDTDNTDNSEMPLNAITSTEEENRNVNTEYLLINDSITSESIINQNPTVLLQDNTITSTIVNVLESLFSSKTQTLSMTITSLPEFVNIPISTSVTSTTINEQ